MLAVTYPLRFNAPLSQPNVLLQMKSEIDLTSKYLALSDIHSRVCIILVYKLNIFKNIILASGKLCWDYTMAHLFLISKESALLET